MQLRTKQPQRRRRAPQQIDLFAEKPQNAIGSMPAWSQQRMTPISETSECQDPKAPDRRRASEAADAAAAAQSTAAAGKGFARLAAPLA